MPFFGIWTTGARTIDERTDYNVPASHNRRNSSSTPFDGSSEASLRIFTHALLDLLNHAGLPLSLVRRRALIESIQQHQQRQAGSASKQVLTEIVFEGILHSPTLDEEMKDMLLRVGFMEQRWDLVFGHLQSPHASQSEVVASCHNDFTNYRRMILRLIRTSRKFQSVPEPARNRLKSMMTRTQTPDQLNDLMFRAMERTCGLEVKEKIMRDIVDLRYYRLLWPDRLDCEEELPPDFKMAASRNCNSSDILYGRVLLPGDVDSIDCCPICLDPVQAPALELSCKHVFCGKCITEWIDTTSSSSSPGATASAAKPSQTEGWHCPLCRNEFKG